MTIDAHYILRFPTEQAAKLALYSIRGSRPPVPGGTFQTGDGEQALMYLSYAGWRRSVVSAASWNGYLNPEVILDAKPVDAVGDSDYERAYGILSDLTHLRSFPEVGVASIHYLPGSHKSMDDPGVKVDEAFLSGLWNLTASRS